MFNFVRSGLGILLSPGFRYCAAIEYEGSKEMLIEDLLKNESDVAKISVDLRNPSIELNPMNLSLFKEELFEKE